ncbi:MAG: ABC transporter permease [Clostridia bacterium]|nr:ABC transporter permease [Clostridia bacterium]
MNSGGKRFEILKVLGDYVILLPIALLIVVWTIFAPNFLTYNNFMNVLRQVSMVAILAAGQYFMICTGFIDFALGALVGLCGIIFAKGMVDWGLPPVIAALAALAVGLLCELIDGTLVTKFHLPAFVATLGMMYIGRGMCYVITNSYPVSKLPASIGWIGRGYIANVLPWPVAIMIIVYVVVSFISKRTKFGRFVYATGGNREAAHLSGINVDLITQCSFLLGGFFSTLTAIILVSRLNSGQPSAGTGYEFQAVIACVMGGVSLSGGKGKALGVILGAIFVGLLTNGMTLIAVDSNWQQVVQGVVLILAITFDVYKQRRQAESR